MTLTILVPLDGSLLADRALPFAASLAADGRGHLVLAHVQPPPGRQASGYDPAVTVASQRGLGVSAESRVYQAPSGEVATALLEAAAEAAADLIVMSTHGRGGMNRWLLGSVSDQMVRRSRVPVLVIPAGCEADGDGWRPEQIMVPLDGSALAESSIEPAARLASALQAEILLARALSPTLHTRYRDGKLVLSCGEFAEIDDAWHYLAELADTLRAAGHRVSVWVVEGSPAAAIMNAARAEGIDIIAMTTHGRGGLGRFLVGSVADGVLRRSHIPILLVRPGMTASAPAERNVAEEVALATTH